MNAKNILKAAALSLLLSASTQAAPAGFLFDYRLQDGLNGLEFGEAGILDAGRLVLNNNGQVAFQARPAFDPFFPGPQNPNIYLNSAIGHASILVPGSLFNSDSPTSGGLPFDYNDNGILAFGVPAPCCNTAGTKLYTTTNGSSFKLLIGSQDLTSYSDYHAQFVGFQFNHLSLNNVGQIAIGRADDPAAGGGDGSIVVVQPFGGSPPVVQSGETARIVTGGIARTVATSSSLPFAQFKFPQINNYGQVAYHGTLGGALPDSGGLFSVDGPGAFSIITTDSPLNPSFCCDNSNPTFAYNDQGVAAYMRYVGQSVTQRELVLSDGRVIATQEDPANPGTGFASLGSDFSLNNLNQVAFMASSPGSFSPEADTLYFWDNGELVRILGIGDIVEGVFTVGAIEMAPGSLNDNGQIAFVARYDYLPDPIITTTALVVAHPINEVVIPEPAALAAFLGLSIAGLTRRTRRSI